MKVSHFITILSSPRPFFKEKKFLTISLNFFNNIYKDELIIKRHYFFLNFHEF